VLVAGPVVALLVLVAALAPLLAGVDPNALNPRAKAQPPSWGHVLGTDEFGRDLWSRLAHGARITLGVGLASTAVAALAGTLLGSVAAYAGRAAESAVMRVMDGLLCFPPILLGIFVVTFLGPSLPHLILVIAILYTPRFTRVVHASTLAVRDIEYVESARALGASAARWSSGPSSPTSSLR
jgi:ABC-type dipeptide/oligopeptide/nickel transport system permease subunit